MKPPDLQYIDFALLFTIFQLLLETLFSKMMSVKCAYKLLSQMSIVITLKLKCFIPTIILYQPTTRRKIFPCYSFTSMWFTHFPI